MGVGEFIIWVIVLSIVFYATKKTFTLVEHYLKAQEGFKKIQKYIEDSDFDDIQKNDFKGL